MIKSIGQGALAVSGIAFLLFALILRTMFTSALFYAFVNYGLPLFGINFSVGIWWIFGVSLFWQSLIVLGAFIARTES